MELAINIANSEIFRGMACFITGYLLKNFIASIDKKEIRKFRTDLLEIMALITTNLNRIDPNAHYSVHNKCVDLQNFCAVGFPFYIKDYATRVASYINQIDLLYTSLRKEKEAEEKANLLQKIKNLELLILEESQSGINEICTTNIFHIIWNMVKFYFRDINKNLDQKLKILSSNDIHN